MMNILLCCGLIRWRTNTLSERSTVLECSILLRSTDFTIPSAALQLCVQTFKLWGPSYEHSMNAEELLYIGSIWDAYFPRDVYMPHDPRLTGILIFRDFFRSPAGRAFISVELLANQKYVHFDTLELSEKLPFSDFELSLRMRPTEVMGFLGIALSLITKEQHPHCAEPFVIRPRFYSLSTETNFGDVKSSTVGQVVSVRGHVVRVSACRPLVESANFMCAKCMKYTFAKFEDGIFIPPAICSTEKCYNKFLELDRSSVSTSDYQRIKLTELDDETQQQDSSSQQAGSNSTAEGQVAGQAAAAVARVPRTLEVEVRDSLVNTCVPGDLLCVVAIVKSVQMEAPRGGGGKGGGGYKESGLHVLYLLANSLLCLKGSGDRLGGGARASSGGGDHGSSGLDGDCEGGTALTPVILDGSTQATQSWGKHQRASSGGASSIPRGVKDNGTFTPGELGAICALALSGHAFPLLVHSLCPTIFGHELVKAGLLLGLFGGSSHKARATGESAVGMQGSGGGAEPSTAAGAAKEFKVRADIHVLVVGDPGLGKSQMLRAAAAVAPRAVFVCGNTSTAAGLTVSISRDASGGGKGGGELCIEAGALILADQGVCCIDELDKITADQHALLEAMEQQSISIAKSGVVTSLKSRCSVLAAANPAGGHYNRKKSVCENLKMNAALLSRFDLIFILLDRPDESHDRMISEHIMGARSDGARSSSDRGDAQKRARDWETPTPLPPAGDGRAELTLQQSLCRRIQDALRAAGGSGSGLRGVLHSGGLVPIELMRRYIEYARQYVHPRLSTGAAKALQRLYLMMRSEASAGQSLPVTTRHLESLIRLSQARARMDLRDEVTVEDAQDVLQLLQESLLDVFTTESGIIDTGRKGGISLAKQVKALVSVMTRESRLRGSNMFSRQDIAALCAKLALDKEVDGLIDVMRTECYLLLKGPRMYQLQTT